MLVVSSFSIYFGASITRSNNFLLFSGPTNDIPLFITISQATCTATSVSEKVRHRKIDTQDRRYNKRKAESTQI